MNKHSKLTLVAYYINADPTPAGYALMTQMLDHVCHGGYGIA
jgi:hypothetical protein